MTAAGDCSFFLKARLRTAGAAADAVRRVTDLLAQGEEACEYWQDARGPGGPPPSCSEEDLNPFDALRV